MRENIDSLLIKATDTMLCKKKEGPLTTANRQQTKLINNCILTERRGFVNGRKRNITGA